MLATMTQNNPQKPFAEVAEDTGLAPELLRKLVRDGVIAGEAPYRRPGITGTCDAEQAQRIATRLKEFRTPVEGNSITVSEAAEKYGFSRIAIYDWVKGGWIKSHGTTLNGVMLIDQGDVAFAHALAVLTNHRAAKALFPRRVKN